MIEWKEFDDPAAEERRLLRELTEPPPRALVHYALAELYMFKRDLPRSISQCHKALEMDPAKHPLYWEFLAQAHQRAGDFAKAIEYLDKLTRLPNPESQHFIDLHEMHTLLDNVYEADETIKRMRRVFPGAMVDVFLEHLTTTHPRRILPLQ